MLYLKNCINKHYYNDVVENNQLEINKNTTTTTHPKNKRKSSSDSEEVIVKKPTVVMSQIDNSFRPNAESTKIINDTLFDSKIEKDEHTQIIEELSLEEIDFEEPFTSKNNKGDKKTYSENNEENKTNDIGEYHKKLMNVAKNIPLQTIQSDNSNVNNFNADDISISQWSKGDVIINRKLLKVFLYFIMVK